MKLNLGAGDHYADGWVNVDIHRKPELGVNPDLVADIVDLPLPTQCASHIYAGHVFEHLEPLDVRAALREVQRLLADDGQMLVVGPDWDRARMMVAAGLEPDSLLDAIKGGEGRWPGDEHRWLSRESSMREYLDESGMQVTSLPIASLAADNTWPVVSYVGWQFALMVNK